MFEIFYIWIPHAKIFSLSELSHIFELCLFEALHLGRLLDTEKFEKKNKIVSDSKIRNIASRGP